jgi:hypothetical protein
LPKLEIASIKIGEAIFLFESVKRTLESVLRGKLEQTRLLEIQRAEVTLVQRSDGAAL